MEQERDNTNFNWINFIDILDSSKIGLWSIEIDNNTGMNRMYCNDTMIQLLGANNNLSPQECFEFWYSRIHTGYYSYVEKAIEKLCTTGQAVEIQYIWKHPELNDITVRCSGKLISAENGIITIKGYHQNINDLHQMNIVLSKTDNEIFEWYQDTNTAYIHTQYSQLYTEGSTIENFPEAWVENGNVQEYFKDIYLSTFQRIVDGSNKSVCELKMKDKNGEYSWFRLTLTKEKENSDFFNNVIGTIENINALKEMEVAYVVENKFYRAILNETLAYIEANITKNEILITGGLWSSYNNILERLSITKVVDDNLYRVIYPDDAEGYKSFLNTDNLIKAYNEGNNIIKYEFRRIINKDIIRWMEITASLFQEPYSKDILGLFYLRDIDGKKREELALKHELETDDLTGLLDKKYFSKKIDAFFDKSTDYEVFYVMIIKVNSVNDDILFDESIKYVSKTLTYIFEDNSIIARINDDEFAIFTYNTTKDYIQNNIDEFYKRLDDFSSAKISCKTAISCGVDEYNYLDIINECKNTIENLSNENNNSKYHWLSNCNDLEKSNLPSKKISSNYKNYTSFDDLVSFEGEALAYIIDVFDYKIIDCNNAFTKMLNKTKEECIGVECYKLIYKRERPCNLCKSIFWSYSDFFVWNQYNRIEKKDFLIKNKLINFNNKKCMYTISTSIYESDIQSSEYINRDISGVILSAISHLQNEKDFIERIKCILDLIQSFYNAQLVYAFEFINDNINEYYIDESQETLDIKDALKNVILNELIPSPVSNIKILNSDKEAITISYSLYNTMVKYHLSNMFIVPIKNNNNIIIGYLLSINNKKLENNFYYDKLEEHIDKIAYFIKDEFIKNKLCKSLDLKENYDDLTGVYNRNAYREFEKIYDPDNNNNIGVICLALNELNNINHSAGIKAGDQIILNLTDILKTQFLPNPIFRLNGNEFLIIMQNIEYDNFINEINELTKSLDKIGLSMTYGKVWTQDEKEINHIVNSAIFLRKSESQKNRQLINENNLSKRNTLFSELMMAIENKEYEIFLQPKIKLRDNSLSGAEALIRKRNLEGGFVAPDKFIPVLEHHYLIQYIDLFVFEEVLKLLETWKNKNQKLIPISLNFSRRTLLVDDIVKKVSDIKNKYDVESKYIEIEVTESIGDLEKQAICTVLKEIESMGISILLDDFGVKYSNLTILSEIEFDGLKLDKTMVRNLGNNKTNEIIMENIISMCKDLNIKTIAEGVETQEQEMILKEMLCDMVQGYYYSKPLPVNEFLEKYYNISI